MKKRIVFVLLVLLIVSAIIPAFAHSGRTDGAGGHTDHSTGEYHYHHGYPAHQHPNGECPYDFDDKTDHSSSGSSSSNTYAPKPTSKPTPKPTPNPTEQVKTQNKKVSSQLELPDIICCAVFAPLSIVPILLIIYESIFKKYGGGCLVPIIMYLVVALCILLILIF